MEFNLSSKTIYLRLVQPEDAAFICSLRNNEQLNKFISASSAEEEAQRNWIINYKSREIQGDEYYFIICRKSDDLEIGTVRLYDFRKDSNSFCWGSWILNDDKTKYAAVESALLVYEAGFNFLGFEQSHYEVMKGNEKVHQFHLRMGAKKTSEDETNVYYVFPKHRYELNKIEYANYLG